jgi:Matrixin
MLKQIILILLISMGCHAADKECSMLTENGKHVSYKGRLPVKIYYDSGFPKEMVHELQLAVNAWNIGMKRDMFKLEGIKFPDTGSDGQENVFFWNLNWDPNYSDSEALTTISWHDGQIYGSETHIDAEFYMITTDNPTYDSQKIDAESLFVHELGHVLGLTHSEDIYSVMNPFLPGRTFRTLLAPSDIANVKCEYGE